MENTCRRWGVGGWAGVVVVVGSSKHDPIANNCFLRFLVFLKFFVTIRTHVAGIYSEHTKQFSVIFLEI